MINRLDFIKIKSICTSKEIIKKRQNEVGHGDITFYPRALGKERQSDLEFKPSLVYIAIVPGQPGLQSLFQKNKQMNKSKQANK